MCGIICGIANVNVVQIVLQGLKRLEYRGYDSAGISIVKNQKLMTVKQSGKVSSLIDSAGKLESNIAIAHTRWATHGCANEKNAHPHEYSGTAWVHNGIINNHLSLRNKLINTGYNFLSDTDTETMGLLYNRLSSDEPIEAIRKCFFEFEGSFAWSLIDQKFGDRIFFAVNNSTMVLGKSEHGYFIASDPLALVGVCETFHLIPYGTLGWCSSQDYQVLDAKTLAPVRIKQQMMNVPENINLAKKHKHHMLEEIYEQPAATKRLLDLFWQNNAPSNSMNSILANFSNDLKMMQFVACGSSYFASLIGKIWFNNFTDWMVACDIASEFKEQKINNNVCSMLVALSQSGETADTIAAFASKDLYQHKMSICNVQHSTLARMSDILFPILAGPEIGVASTKAFINQLLVLLLIAVSNSKDNDINCLLHKIPDLIKATIELEPKIIEIAHKLKNEDKLLFLGRGLLYPVALEGALKLKELSYIHAHAYPAGELKHGPLALIDNKLLTIGLLGSGPQRAKTIANLREIQARDGRLMVFYDGSSNDLSSLNLEFSLELPFLSGHLSVFAFVVAAQMLAYHVAESLGQDVDHPRNLAKSVTVE